jgi:hypothetical protein
LESIQSIEGLAIALFEERQLATGRGGADDKAQDETGNEGDSYEESLHG